MCSQGFGIFCRNIKKMLLKLHNRFCESVQMTEQKKSKKNRSRHVEVIPPKNTKSSFSGLVVKTNNGVAFVVEAKILANHAG